MDLKNIFRPRSDNVTKQFWPTSYGAAWPVPTESAHRNGQKSIVHRNGCKAGDKFFSQGRRLDGALR